MSKMQGMPPIGGCHVVRTSHLSSLPTAVLFHALTSLQMRAGSAFTNANNIATYFVDMGLGHDLIEVAACSLVPYMWAEHLIVYIRAYKNLCEQDELENTSQS